MGRLITPEGKSIFAKKQGEIYSLEELQGFIGGYIEFVWLNNGIIAVCDEDGRCKCKELNIAATMIANGLGYNGAPFVGNILFVKDGEIE